MNDYEDICPLLNERVFWTQILNEIRDLKTRDGVHYLAISKLGSSAKDYLETSNPTLNHVSSFCFEMDL